MSLSPLQKSFLSSACLGSVVFGVSTVPLAIYSSLPVEVQVRNQPVFEGDVNNLAGPYLGLAGTVSAAIGVGVLGVSGWRSAASKSESEKAERQELERNLLACKAELERIKFSEARLKMENLSEFLQPEITPVLNHQQTPSYHVAKAATPRPYEVVGAQHDVMHYKPTEASGFVAASASANGFSNQFEPKQQGIRHAALLNNSSASSSIYPTHSQVAANLGTSPVQHQSGSAEPVSSSHNFEKNPDTQIEIMLNQLHELMTRVESLQAEGSKRMAA